MQAGISCCSVYGAMDQVARKISVGKLRVGKVSVLLVTDVAARGIDIPSIDNVVNYDYPAKPKLFVHRTGRAARAGRAGTAYSFVTAEDMPYLIDTHLFLSRPLKPAPNPGKEAGGGAQGGEACETSDRTTWCACECLHLSAHQHIPACTTNSSLGPKSTLPCTCGLELSACMYACAWAGSRGCI